MIIAYIVENNTLKTIELDEKMSHVPSNVFWMDVIMPTKEDKCLLERLLLVNIPMAYELNIIEVMNPFYSDSRAVYMTITVVSHNSDGYLDSHPVVFILTSSSILITLHHADIEPMRNIVGRLSKLQKIPTTSVLLLKMIVEMFIARIANVLDTVGNDLDSLTRNLFKKSIKNKKSLQGWYYNEVIEIIGRTGNLISKNRESLVSLSRFAIFCAQISNDRSTITEPAMPFKIGAYDSDDDLVKASNISEQISGIGLTHIMSEISSLESYAIFLDQRNGFLLSATLGLISVEQNTIMKIFALIASLFTPPMLVTSIYGMNFKNMPELYTDIGYPAVLILAAFMIFSSYLLFKKKGWF